MHLIFWYRFDFMHLSAWSNFILLHNSHRITFPTQSCLVLYSFYASLLHLLIIWFTVSSPSPHNLHLQFLWKLSIFDLILVLIALFCAAIKRDSTSPFTFPLLSHNQVIWTAISLICYLKYPYSCFSLTLFCFLELFIVVFLFVLKLFMLPLLDDTRTRLYVSLKYLQFFRTH